MMVPTIHLNGSPGERLLDEVREAGNAIDRAIHALADAAPNARDYYPQGADAYQAADAEHRSRLHRLVSVRDELAALSEVIADAMAARAR